MKIAPRDRIRYFHHSVMMLLAERKKRSPKAIRIKPAKISEICLFVIPNYRKDWEKIKSLTSLWFLLKLVMYLLKVREEFSAAHALKEYKGECEDFHGHNYRVQIEILVKELPPRGYLYDFKEIRDYLKGVLPDHKNLNEFFSFNPTAENIAHWLFHKVKERYPIRACEVWESENSGVRYEE